MTEPSRSDTADGCSPEGEQPSDCVTGPAAGSLVELRKPHACGGLRWSVTRIGADVGLHCQTCGRRILLPRDEFQRRLRRIVAAG